MTQPKPRSVLSIDVGKKRVGLAGCDPLGITIKPLPALIRGSFEQDLKTLKIHCDKRKVEGLVIGLPLDLNGFQTKQAVYCQRYGKRLAKALDLPVAWVNEQCSSWSTAQRYNLQNDKTGQLDSVVASILLDQWLKEGPEPLRIHTADQPKKLVDCNAG